MTYRQSVCWWCFVPGSLQPAEFVKLVAEIGFPAVELVPQQYWPLCKAYGLQLASHGGHTSIEVGLNRRDQHERIVKELRANLRLAEQWGIANLICSSGNRAGMDDYSGIDTVAEGLAKVAKDAENAGVNLVLELLNSRVDHPDYHCDNTAWGLEVCRKVASPRVKLLYDIYHMQIMEGDLIRTIKAAAPYIGHYHTAGNPGRNDLDADQEINYAPVLRTIAETGYTGFVGNEFIPKGDPGVGLREAMRLGRGVG